MHSKVTGKTQSRTDIHNNHNNEDRLQCEPDLRHSYKEEQKLSRWKIQNMVEVNNATLTPDQNPYSSDRPIISHPLT
jgi:hypothetical protein